ncbi:MAG: chemotaxis protein CheW [Candidatus Gastranaerophilaceae bacterium]|jgi:purine-binding chemotaxis protein CheW
MLEEFKDQKELQMIVFKLDDENYAVPIKYVQEIITSQIITHLPKLPAIEGVINLRGHIVPIIHGKSKFGLPLRNKYKHDRRIIMFDINNKTIGLIVDEVSEVIHLKTTEIEPPPDVSVENFSFIQGVGKYHNKRVILVDPEKLLTCTESNDIKKLNKMTEIIQQSQDSLISTSSVF